MHIYPVKGVCLSSRRWSEDLGEGANFDFMSVSVKVRGSGGLSVEENHHIFSIFAGRC